MKPIKTLLALQVALLVFLSIPAGAAPLPRGAEIKVNTNTIAWHYNPSVAVFPDGGFVVVFTAGPRWDQSGRRVIHARLFDSQGKPTSGQFRLIDKVAGSQFVDQVVADRDGSFLVVWTETAPDGPRRLFVRRFNRDGTPRGERIQVHKPSRSDRSNGVLAIGPDGRFVVAWESDVRLSDEAGYTDAAARIFTAQGKPVAREFIVLNGYYGIGDDTIHVYPRAAALGPDGTLSFLVQSYEFSHLQTDLVRYPAGSSSRIIPMHTPSSCCLTSYDGASLVMNRDGSLMAVWSEDQITARRLTPSGEEARPFVVSEKSTDTQVDPVLARHADGSFVAVWSENRRDGAGNGVFGRAFAADGTPLSRDFRVNTTTAGHQQSPAISASSRGPVVVVWEQIAANGRADIYARLLR